MANLDDLNQRHLVLCAVIRTRTEQLERLRIELDELHAEAEQLEREIAKESSDTIRQAATMIEYEFVEGRRCNFQVKVRLDGKIVVKGGFAYFPKGSKRGFAADVFKTVREVQCSLGA